MYSIAKEEVEILQYMQYREREVENVQCRVSRKRGGECTVARKRRWRLYSNAKERWRVHSSAIWEEQAPNIPSMRFKVCRELGTVPATAALKPWKQQRYSSLFQLTTNTDVLL